MGGHLSALVDAINHPEREKEIKKAFNSYDKNKNGTIEADELALLGKDLQKLLGAGHHDSDEWKNEARAMSPDELVKKWMDKNGDKSVSYDEFKAFINSLAHK